MAYSKHDFQDGQVLTGAAMDDIDSAVETLDAGMTAAQEDIAELQEWIATKAEIDGYYETLTAGNAEQLLSTVGAEDSVPYTFRTAGGSIDIGDRAVEKIVGGTVAWNQLNNNGGAGGDQGGVTVTNNGDGTWTLSGGPCTAGGRKSIATGMGNLLKANHLCYITPGSATDGSASTWRLVITQAGSIKTTVIARGGSLHHIAANSNTFDVQIMSGADFTGAPVTLKPQIFDLTAMFGSAVAEAVFAMEQASAGAGVAWFKALFPESYYPYNAGELMSVQTSGKKAVGFNLWDEEWENGVYSTANGNKVNNSARIRSKNKIPVLPNTVYWIGSSVNATWVVLFYDTQGSYTNYSNVTNSTFTTPINCAHIAFCSATDFYGTTYKNDICIHLAWDGSRNGEYEPYKSQLYPLDSSLTLRGIPKWDSTAGAMYYDGDEYASDGTVTRKYGIVDLGTLQWAQYNVSYGVCFFATPSPTPIMRFIGITPAFVRKQVSYTSLNNKEWTNYSGGGTALFVRDDSYTTVADFKSSMSGVYLVYELATPTTETADPYTGTQWVDDFGTEEFIDAGVTAGTRDVSIPVGHVTTYQQNLRAKLEMAPKSPSGDGDYIVRCADGMNAYVPLPAGLSLSDVLHLLAADFSESTRYLQNDLVVQDGKLYIRIANTVGYGEWVADDWWEISIDGAISSRTDVIYNALDQLDTRITRILPDAPTADGTYHLKATVSGGAVTYSWEADS